MSTAELKEKIIAEVSITEDENLLKDMLRFLHLQNGNDNVYILNDDEISAVHEAQAQYGRGEFITDEEAQKESEEWLKE